MTTKIIGSFVHRASSRDEEGHREYSVIFLIEGAATDGPVAVRNTAGLPVAGSIWNFGGSDPWAFCKLTDRMEPTTGQNKKALYWHLEKFFTTRSSTKSCKNAQVDDPLAQLLKISWGGANHKKEATHDRHGEPIVNAALEPIRGPQNEWDDNTGKIMIEQNVAVLQYALCDSMRNTVNEKPIWGMPARCVKLSDFRVEKKYQGECSPYFTRHFTFETNSKGFDRSVLNESSRVLNGKWNKLTGQYERMAVGKDGVLNPELDGTLDPTQPINPNPNNPQHFVRYKDRRDENTRTILYPDGPKQGTPWNPEPNIDFCTECPDGAPVQWFVEVEGKAYVLNHDVDCTWKADDGEGHFPVILDFDGTDWVVSLYDDEGELVSIWTIAADLWACLGPNTLIRNDETDTITVAPEKVPHVSIEYYGESDFLLLGLPEDLEA